MPSSTENEEINFIFKSLIFSKNPSKKYVRKQGKQRNIDMIQPLSDRQSTEMNSTSLSNKCCNFNETQSQTIKISGLYDR